MSKLRGRASSKAGQADGDAGEVSGINETVGEAARLMAAITHSYHI